MLLDVVFDTLLEGIESLPLCVGLAFVTLSTKQRRLWLENGERKQDGIDEPKNIFRDGGIGFSPIKPSPRQNQC